MNEDKRAYYEQVFGKEKADEIMASLENKAKHLSEIQAAFKDFTSIADTTDTKDDTAAQANAGANLKELALDLVGDVSDLTSQQAVISKEQNALRLWVTAQLEAQHKEIAALKAENKALKDELALTPKGRASDSAATETEDKDLAAKIADKDNKQTDPFWAWAVEKGK